MRRGRRGYIARQTHSTHSLIHSNTFHIGRTTTPCGGNLQSYDMSIIPSSHRPDDDMGVKKVLHDGIPLNREASYASSRSNSRSNSSGRRTSSRMDPIFNDDFRGSYIPFRSESKSSPPSPCETMIKRDGISRGDRENRGVRVRGVWPWRSGESGDGQGRTG